MKINLIKAFFMKDDYPILIYQMNIHDIFKINLF
jgi:hypothetical protein